MTKTTLITLAIFSLVFLPALAVPAAAQSGSLEIYGGVFDPDDTELTTYGLRGGYRANDRLGVEATVGIIDLEEVGDIDLIDLSVKAYLGNPTGKAQFFAFAGPGWARLDSPFFEGDSFTANVGVGADLHLGEVAYLRPDVRWRWFEDGDESDFEVTLALGFTFGK